MPAAAAAVGPLGSGLPGAWEDVGEAVGVDDAEGVGEPVHRPTVVAPAANQHLDAARGVKRPRDRAASAGAGALTGSGSAANAGGSAGAGGAIASDEEDFFGALFDGATKPKKPRGKKNKKKKA